jgi:outer membrane protein/adhesin transport system outer membrane protein
LLAAILTLACVTPLRAQERAAQSLSLDQAIVTAVSQNPSYRESLVAVDAGVGRVRAARASLGPSVTLSDAYQYQDTVAKLPTPFGPLPFSPNSTNIPLLGASYTLFDGGAGAARLAAASASLSSTQASARQARAGLISQVSSAYYDLVAAIQNSAVAERGVDVAQAHVELAMLRLRAGQIPRAELLQAQTDLADRRVGAIAARNDVELDQNRLDATMNVPLGTVYAPTDGLGGEIPAVDLQRLIATAKTQRGDLAAARLAVEAAERAVGAARAQRSPSVALSASEGNVQPVVTTGYHSQFTVGLDAVWKLFDDGYTDGRVAEARAAVSQAQLEVERLQVQAELEVRQAYLALDAAREQVEASKQLVVLAGENRRLAEIRYRGGVGTALELRDAELRDDAARQSVVDAERSLMESVVSLRFAAGLI